MNEEVERVYDGIKNAKHLWGSRGVLWRGWVPGRDAMRRRQESRGSGSVCLVLFFSFRVCQARVCRVVTLARRSPSETAHAPNGMVGQKMKRRSAPPTHACMYARPNEALRWPLTDTRLSNVPRTTQYGRCTLLYRKDGGEGPKSTLDVHEFEASGARREKKLKTRAERERARTRCEM